MGDFTFPSKRNGWIYGVRGTVTSASKWTESHVSSSGGGGFIANGSGYVNAPQVSTTVVERGEFWVRTSDGKEVRISENLPVAPGHEVVVLWGDVAGKKWGSNLYWCNCTSQMHSAIQNKKCKQVAFYKIRNLYKIFSYIRIMDFIYFVLLALRL
ncbi:hypothetical protein M2322_001433 [Rhodoblastus acidophilus]|uniref:hypothetical protein n=1 Tax=Rhodoblastus acidophilus TaxID=1074 RepID=UPI0022242FAB|nr:hypothetical protein [Rhodoblastus acidophilus]MCW2315889.1 hypothetical protein [Rhodoblastus acidophilus]